MMMWFIIVNIVCFMHFILQITLNARISFSFVQLSFVHFFLLNNIKYNPNSLIVMHVRLFLSPDRVFFS